MAAFFLAACGGDGNKANEPAPSAEADFVVDTFGDLSVCTGNREGATAYVKDEDHDYICTNGDWAIDTNADTRKKSSSSSATSYSSSSVTLATPCKTETEDNCEYGELLDTRDGQTYKTVKIGDQVWMAENLNYKVDSSWCGGRGGENEGGCTKYGRLYTWAAAVGKSEDECGYDKTCGLSGKVRGVCPEGWHLPDTTEWNKLFTAVGGESVAGKMLKAQTGWNRYYGGGDANGTDVYGTDVYGFSAFPAGDRDYDGYFYTREGNNAYFWSATATEGSSDYAYGMGLNYSCEYANLGNGNKDDALSVRCLKDDP
jgi:uncharacterized protein (TIGR02145 family)